MNDVVPGGRGVAKRSEAPAEVYADGWRRVDEDGTAAAWRRAERSSALDVARGLAGEEGVAFKIHAGRDGSFVPEPHPFRLGFWLHDVDAGRLHTPETMQTRWTLEDGRLPIVRTTWCEDQLLVTVAVFGRLDGISGKLVAHARLRAHSLTGAPRRVNAYLVLRPGGLIRKDATMGSIRMTVADNAVFINDRRVIRFAGGSVPSAKTEPIIWDGVAPIEPSASLEGPADELKAAILLGRMSNDQPAQWDIQVLCDSSGEVEVKGSWDQHLAETVNKWRERIPLRLTLPDRATEDAFYASLNYLLLLSSGNELRPGPFHYASFYLHDAVEMVEALNRVGLHDVARRSLQPFAYREEDLYLDGIGGCAYTLFDHYRITRDREFLAEVYPRIVDHCRRLMSLRGKRMGASYAGGALYGLLPESASQDNFKTPAHLYLDSWWSTLGFKAGELAAENLGQTEDQRWMQGQFVSQQAAVLASLKYVMNRDGLSCMPAFADAWPPEERVVDPDHRLLGATQIAWAHRPAVCPGLGMGLSFPEELFRASYEHYWKDAGRFSGYNGGWFVEYEGLFWGYNVLLARPLVYLGLKDIALKNLAWSLANQTCPGGWSEAMKSVVNEQGLREVAPGIVGDVPHGWTAAHYVLLVREMLLHERGAKLVLLSCIPDPWTAPGCRIEISGAPTCFGEFEMEVMADEERIDVSFSLSGIPPGGYLIHPPSRVMGWKVLVDGQECGVTTGQAVPAPPQCHHVRFCR